MKQISEIEYKTILYNILTYFDNVCRRNNINYTLIGGSLIGAVRHNEIIPWDDDIDVSISVKDKERLIEALSENSRYKLLYYGDNQSYPYTFMKLVDTNTVIKEKGVRDIKDAGVFIDIFTRHNVPDNKIIRTAHYGRLKIISSLIKGNAYDEEQKRNEPIIKKIRTRISNLIGNEKLQNRFRKLISMYDRVETKNVMNDLVFKNMKTDIHESVIFNNYQEYTFGPLKVQSIQEYDRYLSQIFGDYMIPPEEKDRVKKHNIKANWKKET